MSAKTRYVRVAVPIHSDKLFTYLVPDALESKIDLGSRVLVGLGRRRVTGFVVAYDSKPVNGIRDIEDVVWDKPLFSKEMLELTHWVADYYMCSWGEALKAAVPPGSEVKERKRVRALREHGEDLSKREREILALIPDRGSISSRHLGRLFPGADVAALLSRLERKKAVLVTSSLGESALTRSVEMLVKLNDKEEAASQLEALRKKAPRQSAVLDHLLRSATASATWSELRELLSIPISSVHSLEKKGLIQTETIARAADAAQGTSMEEPPPPKPTPHQEQAMAAIDARLMEGVYRTMLLHGVTGSGKTEVYIRTAARAVSRGKQAIILVPEISLTPQTASRFIARFGTAVALLHSRLSVRERADIWRRIDEGDFDVVIGPRSAVFAPARRLGLIVVDEEQEPSYKQGDLTPRYNARDVAVMRARIENCLCILGSATPSLESYHNALTGKYDLIELPERIDKLPMPSAEVVDMKTEQDTVFSEILIKKIQDRISKGEQVMLFLNRRGFSRFVLCRDCGYVDKCPNCSVSLTYHQSSRTLTCHYCGHKKKAYDVCPGCRGTNLLLKGIGTERVEEKLKTLFPEIRVLRMDMDTTRRKHAHREIFQAFRRREADVLLGTQMIAKGLDFPDLTLVGVVSADTSINLPDLRSAERTFQLLTQVAGRTGRSSLGGEVVIQTFSPDLQVIETAASQEYREFYRSESVQRNELDYPPFSRIAKLTIKSSDKLLAQDTAAKLRRAIEKTTRRNGTEVKVLGPAPAAVFRLKGSYRYTILLKAKEPMQVQKTLGPVLASLSTPTKVKLVVDIDPVEVF